MVVQQLLPLAALAACLAIGGPAHAAPPAAHRSFEQLISSNGRVAVVFDAAAGARRVNGYFEHLYRFGSSDTAASETRNLAYDAYFGIRVGSQHSWLTEVPIANAGYLDDSGIIVAERQFSGLRLTTQVWAPFDNAGPLFVLALTVENPGSAPSEPLSIYSLQNFHLGNGRPAPDATGEHVVWDGVGASETGPGGVAMAYLPLPAPTAQGATPNNPYAALLAGDDLAETLDSGVVEDAVSGFQWKLGPLAAGAKKTVGVLIGHHAGGDPAAARALLTAYRQGRELPALLQAERDNWSAWRAPAPSGLSAPELALWRQSEAVLRMAQVSEPGAPEGQIVASLPPGRWNIAWVRDMSYAIVALARSGHSAEAWRGLRFMLTASAGNYQQYVGRPYQLSVTRYFGNGQEESDHNADGPNVEFDGFGLFLWALAETVDAAPELAWQQHWPTVRDGVADVLVALQDAETGLIAADSSIWEVHWNGRQKRYTYTSAAAARGLCAAAGLAQIAGDTTRGQSYRAASRSIRAALLARNTDDAQLVAQSYEELAGNAGYLDAAVIEMINWGLLDPGGPVAQKTLDAIFAGLRPPSGRGLFRNDDGGWYDQQEWVFIDLRAAIGLRLAQRTAEADAMLGWIVEQASHNGNLIAELHDAQSADYRGEVPMAGFGAGAYLTALAHRQHPPSTSDPCGFWHTPAVEPDAGTPATTPDAGVDPAGDRPNTTAPWASDGCQLSGTRRPGSATPTLLWLVLAWVATRARPRRDHRRQRRCP